MMKKKIFDALLLLFGAICMTFTGLNWQIAIFAWLAPICLLFYTRKSGFRRFVAFFLLMFIAGYFSQTCNNVFKDLPTGIINGLIYTLIHTIIYLLDKLFHNQDKRFYTTLIFPSIFTLVEYSLSTLIGTSGIVAQSQFLFKPFAQLSTVTGLFGITFIVTWFASIVFWIYENNFSKISIRKGALIFGFIFISIGIFGLTRISFQPKVERTIKVATISSSFDLHAYALKEKETLIALTKNDNLKMPERFFASDEITDAQLDNTLKAARSGAKIIVWNEDALLVNKKQQDALLLKAKEISKTYNTYILLSVLEEDTVFDAKLFNNKSLLITSKGELAWEYLKSNLAPSEIPIVNRGNSVIPFIDTEYGRIGNVICFDLDFPAFLRQAGKNKVDIMLVPSYDWNKYAKLHSKMAQFEALQSGFSLIRSNGAGINMITDKYGNIIEEANTFDTNKKILYANLPLSTTRTLYSIIGNKFVLFCLAVILFVLFKNSYYRKG